MQVLRVYNRLIVLFEHETCFVTTFLTYIVLDSLFAHFSAVVHGDEWVELYQIRERHWTIIAAYEFSFC